MEELSFGQWLSRQRKSLGLTQKMLAERVNCATITIRKMEAEQRRPSLQVLERLAQTFNVPHNEQGAFIQYARGYKPSSPAFARGEYPWHPAGVLFHPELLPSLLTHIQYEHLFQEVSGIYLDETIHTFTQADHSAESAPVLIPEVTHSASTNPHAGQFILLLVPVEVPAELANAFGPQHGLREITGKHLNE